MEMKPLAILPAEYGLRFPVQVDPTAMVEFQGIRYAMPAAAFGIPATLHLYPDRVRISSAGGRFESTHPRFPQLGRTSYLAGQRAGQLAAVAGVRKRLYFMRERILELGPVGAGYHRAHPRRPFTWKTDVERLFALLEEVGDGSRSRGGLHQPLHRSPGTYKSQYRAGLLLVQSPQRRGRRREGSASALGRCLIDCVELKMFGLVAQVDRASAF